MSPESILVVAISKKTPAERGAYLDEACGTDRKLRQEIEDLIKAHESRGEFMEKPVVEQTAAFAPNDSTTGFTQPSFNQIGPYKLREKLGEGGMGTVYVADQKEPVQRRVAIKLIKGGSDSKGLLARFEQERQALALMDHPNIAKVFDAGVFERTPYFVMELIKGVPLTKYCDDARLSPKQRLELFIPVCQAVQHAHQKGIIHRDLKPSNILIGLYDGKPIPKIIDFGIAKATGSRLTDQSIYTEVGSLVGTLEYMSPEQAELNNLDIDTRSDIYALGVILYELLTSSVPFSRKDLALAGFGEMLRVIKEVEPSKPSTKLSGSGTLPSIAANRHMEPAKLSQMVRGELDWIVMKCLEKDRGRRYETANQLGMEIQRYLSDEPVLAGPPSTGYRLKKFVKRNRAMVIAAGVVLGTLLLGMAGTTWGFFLANAQRVVAEQAQSAEKEQRKKAELAEAETLDDYRASSDDAIEQLIGSKPTLGPQEKAYLEKTLKRWQEFAKRQGDDERSMAIRGEGHFRVAFLWARLGRNAEAKVEYQQAREIREKLVAQSPTVPVYQEALATTCHREGIIFRRLGKRAEASTGYQRARDLQQKLIAQYPGNLEYRHQLSKTLTSIGTLLNDAGKPAEGLREYRASQDLLIQLTKQAPGNSTYSQELAGTYFSVAQSLSKLGQGKEALQQSYHYRDILLRMVEQSPMHPELQLKLAEAHYQIGHLLSDLGEDEPALVETGKARSLFGKLAEQFPTVPAYQLGLANTYNSLGGIKLDFPDGNLDARKQFHLACESLRTLIKQYPDVPEYQKELSLALGNLGHALDKAGMSEQAVLMYQESRDIQKQLVEHFPRVAEYQESLATSNMNLATALRHIPGKLADSRVALQLSCDILQKLITQFPTIPRYQLILAGNYCNYGKDLHESGQSVESLKWYDLAILRLQPIHDKEPHNAKAKEFLRNCHKNRAIAYDKLLQPAEAVKAWELAIELAEPAKRDGYRLNRLTSQIHAGQIIPALAEIDALLSQLSNKPTPAASWYDFACLYALAGSKVSDKKQIYTDRAMELLQKAVQAGYRDVARLSKNKELDALRDRDDFKKLIKSLTPATPRLVQ